MVENDLTGLFMPHGYHHPLARAAICWPCKTTPVRIPVAPAKYPHSRCTRIIEPRMVLDH